jgi:uncharacterized membrane protein YbaN (DUF454 family)
VRAVYLLAGLVMTGFGIAGVFLPLLPTTPFLLAAIWFFSRSSPRLEHWLLNHPRLGPPLRDWKRDGAISVRAKIMAVGLMALSFAFFMVSRSPSLLVATIVAAILCSSALFIVTRPLPKRDR